MQVVSQVRYKDIECLRVYASVLVAVYHIWFNKVSGGVDVFFVVAAFLLTTSLIKKDSFNLKVLINYYVSTIRRVSATTCLVVFVSLLAVYYILPPFDWVTEVRHAFTTLLFIENWHLAYIGIDYLESDSTPSVFQHFWALSLQMQFYLLLPLIILLCNLLRNKLGRKGFSIHAGVFALLIASSFIYSIWFTNKLPSWAYFDSFTRGWEFFIGCLLAVYCYMQKNMLVFNKLFSLLAFSILLLFGSFSHTFHLPGFLSLVPVLCAVLIILGAVNQNNISLLRLGSVSSLGKFSFGFYLWHWPILIIMRHVNQSDEISLIQGLAIILVAAMLAIVTYYIAESPFKAFIDRRKNVLIKLVSIFIIFLIPASTLGVINKEYTQLRVQAEQNFSSKNFNSLYPDPLVAEFDKSNAYENGCQQKPHIDTLIVCYKGDEDADINIALVGGSHSLQFLDVIAEIGSEIGFRTINVTKSACMFSLSKNPSEISNSCIEWNSKLNDWLAQNKPDVVITIASRGGAGKGVYYSDLVPSGYTDSINYLNTLNIPVIGIRDNPWFKSDIPRCISMFGANFLEKCSRLKSQVYNTEIDHQYKSITKDDIYFIDFKNKYCSNDYCKLIDNGILMYRDRHHLTGTYTKQLKPELKEHISKALDKFNLTK